MRRSSGGLAEIFELGKKGKGRKRVKRGKGKKTLRAIKVPTIHVQCALFQIPLLSSDRSTFLTKWFLMKIWFIFIDIFFSPLDQHRWWQASVFYSMWYSCQRVDLSSNLHVYHWPGKNTYRNHHHHHHHYHHQYIIIFMKTLQSRRL